MVKNYLRHIRHKHYLRKRHFLRSTGQLVCLYFDRSGNQVDIRLIG